jgi:hypothetical protein
MIAIVRRLRDSRGQSVIEMAMVMPLLIVIVLGVIEVSYALLDQHIVTKLTREGSNLISRNTSLQDATTALKSMSSGPVDFTKNSTLIFTVLRNVPTTTAANFNHVIVYQRYQYGAISAASKLTTRGGGSFGPAPDYQANNADNDTSLQVSPLPSNLALGTGDMVYVTEIFTKHDLITPFDKFGIRVPQTLYSIAFF